jgi:adenosylcobinamide-GDP ribazoletransferase
MLNNFKHEINIFFVALMFYSRLPCPKWLIHKPEYLNEATRYFPVVGWIVGGLSSVVLIALMLILPVSVALLGFMLMNILLTGAFHEDGFADVCDGFGGGWTAPKILEIMKDSRLGTYGTVGILFMLAFKFELLRNLLNFFNTDFWLLEIVIFLISAHSVSRLLAATTLYTHSYVRENEDAKAKPLAKKISLQNLLITIFLGILPVFFFVIIDLKFFLMLFFVVVPLLYLIKILMSAYFKKWIGGYTGDCLGAIQQVTEIGFYLGALILIRNF